MFRSKRKGLYIGGAKEEQLQLLIDKIKAAKADGRGLTFFLWKNEDEQGPPFSLNVDVDNSDERNARKKVENDDDDLFPEPASKAGKSSSFFDDED
jgi:hypothetical protein